jgi:hypothetical protein
MKGEGKTKESEHKGTSHSSNLIYFSFLREWSFDSLLSFQNILTSLHFQMIC